MIISGNFFFNEKRGNKFDYRFVFYFSFPPPYSPEAGLTLLKYLIVV